MISDIRVICPLFVQARSQENIAFYVVTQTQNHDGLNLADVDSDVQAILGEELINLTKTYESLKSFFYYNF